MRGQQLVRPFLFYYKNLKKLRVNLPQKIYDQILVGNTLLKGNFKNMKTQQDNREQEVVTLPHFFSMWVFFHEHSRFTAQQGKVEGIYLTSFYHFLTVHGHLDISRAITAESSPLHLASSRNRTGNLWFPSASR